MHKQALISKCLKCTEKNYYQKKNKNGCLTAIMSRQDLQ